MVSEEQKKYTAKISALDKGFRIYFQKIDKSSLVNIATEDLTYSGFFENKMLIFPANFKHEVYPFYTSDEERITVSGNIKFFNG